MNLPLGIAIRNFFGVFVLTPFEEELLERLREALGPADREAVTAQIKTFTTVRRLLKHLDEPNAHGFTNFYTTRFGKDVSDSRHTKRLASRRADSVLATARVLFEGGEIEVTFLAVDGVLFAMDYRSPQRIYYPPTNYRIAALKLAVETK
jgi:hypothetical protein